MVYSKLLIVSIVSKVCEKGERYVFEVPSDY